MTEWYFGVPWIVGASKLSLPLFEPPLPARYDTVATVATIPKAKTRGLPCCGRGLWGAGCKALLSLGALRVTERYSRLANILREVVSALTEGKISIIKRFT